MQPIKVCVVGGSGYTGAELLRLIINHPAMQLCAVYAHTQAGKSLAEVFPAFAHINMRLQAFNVEHVAEHVEVAFLGLPHGHAQEASFALRQKGIIVIDLSADHRFNNADLYAQIYGKAHRYPDMLAQAVYGLPEMSRDAIKTANLIACPGCYPTSVTLALLPIIHAGLLQDGQIIADCKSGVSGAGRSAAQASLFSERGEGMQGYKTLAHRHAPEIIRNLKRVAHFDTSQASAIDHTQWHVHFVPHLVPMSRGILSTVYVRIPSNMSQDDIQNLYTEYYQSETFVSVLPSGHHAHTTSVRGSNRCQIDLTVQAGLLVIHAVIDNLGKGAAGQAIQCFNIRQGLPESLGVSMVGMYP